MKTMIIDDVEYTSGISDSSEITKLKYVIVRSYYAGVFAGYLKNHSKNLTHLIDARCIWRWSGAFTLCELSQNGADDPENCKFSIPVKKILLTEVCSIIECSDKAKKIIQGIKSYEPTA